MTTPTPKPLSPMEASIVREQLKAKEPWEHMLQTLNLVDEALGFIAPKAQPAMAAYVRKLVLFDLGMGEIAANLAADAVKAGRLRVVGVKERDIPEVRRYLYNYSEQGEG